MKKRNGPRIGRIFVETANQYFYRTALLGAIAAAVGVSGCGDAEVTEGEELGTVSQAFDPSPQPSSPHGHVQITMRALKLLEARGMLPDALKGAANQALIVYGNNFGDRTSSGWPNGGAPTQPILNRMSARVSGTQPLVYKTASGSFQFDAELNDFPWDDPTITTSATATIGWYPGKTDPVGDPNGDFLSTSMRLNGTIKVETDVILDGLWTGAKCVGWVAVGAGECKSVQPDAVTRPLSFAVDNMYHYSYADLRDTGAAFDEADTALRLYPFFNKHVPGWDGTHTEQDAAVKLSDALRGQTLLTGADYGAQKYGSILFQIARRFFANSPQPEPDLAQLVKVGNDVSGWHTGYMQGHGGLASLALEYPHTYLGGMPYVCGPPAPLTSGGLFGGANNAVLNATRRAAWAISADPCAIGTPAWPSWILNAPPQTEADLQALEQPRPGRSDRSALIYLGWATHMMQDSAVPHHAAGWTGAEHALQDALPEKPYYWTDHTGMKVTKTTCIYPGGKLGPPSGCTQTLVPHPYSTPYYTNQFIDRAMAGDLDNLLGPVGQNKSRNEICRGLGVTSGDGSSTDLNWRAIYPLYLETARKAYDSRREHLESGETDAAGLEYTKNAVLGTIKLLLCSQPEAENLALNRPSWESSTLPGYDVGPWKANDGNTSGNFWDGSVNHSEYGFTWGVPDAPGQWWYVDLGGERVVTAVNVFNRTDCCSERLSHYKVLAWDSSTFTWKVISDQSNTDTTGLPVINHAIANVKTQYVMVAKTDENYLHLAEVQVIGS
jgi:hypothetical protein